MAKTTRIFANTLSDVMGKRLDYEKLVRLLDAPDVAAAQKMLGDYGFFYTQGASIDGFIVGETEKFIEFIYDTASDAVAEALCARFWYNNVKLAYKSRYVQVDEDSFYRLPRDCSGIAHGDYSDAENVLADALYALDASGEKRAEKIDLVLTRAMYNRVLRLTSGRVRRYFQAEIDLKNILSAARMRRLNIIRDEFISGGTIKCEVAEESIKAKDFALCFIGTDYEDAAERLSAAGFSALGAYERDADDYLFSMTDALCKKMTTYEPFLNYYTQTLIELKTVKTALVCIKTGARDEFFERMPGIYK